nr:nuclear pore complex protein Nup205 [Ciona intestinalis]|eukprot:XP_026690792.1 nuclear pore complex protein Nup205 [Ciona intestinalis]
MQQAWLLRTVAIELYSLSLKRQRVNAERILKVLFSSDSCNLIGSTLNASRLLNQSSDVTNLTTRALAGDVSVTQHSMSVLDASASVAMSSQRKELSKMLKTFGVLDLVQEFPNPLTLEQFIPSIVEQAISSCEATNEHGIIQCDVKALHNILEASCTTLSSSEDANRKQLAIADMQNILQNAMDRNMTRETVHAKLSFLTGWRHTLEVALTACPVDLLSKEARQEVLLSTLQHLVNTARSSDATQELTSPIAGIVLMIIVQIRASFFGDADPNITLDGSISAYETKQEISLASVAPLQVVVRGAMEWLLQAGLPAKVRTHLYTALLYYLQLCQKPNDSDKKKSRHGNLMLLASSEDIYARLNRDNLQLLQEYGDTFMDLLCKDASSGYGVCRVLAFACLDAIHQIDTHQTWLQYMVKNGYMAHIAHSFSQEDASLQESLDPNQDTPRSVFIYEQKMALLCSIAETQGGARAIIDCGILTQLAECNFLQMRPESNDSELGSSALSRYQQLLFPTFHLCSALLATLGGQSHHEVSALVLQFLLSHVNPIVNSVLKSQAIHTDIQALTELKLLTSILSETAGQDFSDPTMYPSIPTPVLLDIQGHLMRIQRQMLFLLPSFFLTDQLLKDLETKSKEEGSDFGQILTLIHEIGSNILTYARVVVAARSPDADSTFLLFSPSLAESSFGNPGYDDHRRQPALGALMRILHTCVSRFIAQRDSMSQQEWKISNIETLSSQDLNEVINGGTPQTMSRAQEKKVAEFILKQSVQQKTHLLECLYNVLENCLLLLWQHVDYYVLRAVPTETANANILFPSRNQSDTHQRSLRKLQEFSESFVGHSSQTEFGSNFSTPKSAGLRKETIVQLKMELASSLPDHFLKKLTNIEIPTKGTAASFMQPIVRRLQHIVKLH